MSRVLGIDVGGSGVKGAPVDVETGEMLAKRLRIPTPRPATPTAVMETAARIASHFEWVGPIGCGVPAVVRDGVARSAANIDQSWIGVDAAGLLADLTGCPVRVLNDADAAGLAEVSYGAGRSEDGVVLVFTFGTGIGSALFSDGALVPNVELGHLEFHGRDAEHYAASRLVEDDAMPLAIWAARVSDYLQHVTSLFSPDLIIFGGGISKRFDDFASLLDVDTRVVPAELRNHAGIVGAALAADRRRKEHRS
jgi:polyphosphate glucokinase